MTRVVCIADTHCAHRDLEVPAGDILIHAGDALCDGTAAELGDFLAWMGAQTHSVKIYVPGNHDELFWWDLAAAMAMVPAGVTVLIGQAMTALGHLEVFGAPWTAGMVPEKDWRGGAMAFSMPDGQRAREWESAPAVVDILVAHAPPLTVAKAAGDNLVDRVIWQKSPRLVVCGHVHWARGVYQVDNSLGEGQTTVVNAACCGPVAEVLQPIVVDI